MTDLGFKPARTLAGAQPSHRAFIATMVLVGVGASSALQVGNVTVTALSALCLLCAPAFLLMTHRGIELLPLVLAAFGWLSFLASCLVNHTSILWPNALAPAAFALYFVGLTVLTGRVVESIASVLAGIAIGTIGFFLLEGIPLTHTGGFFFFWKYGVAHAVTILVVFGLAKSRLPQLAQPVALALLGLASLGLNFRSHALVCIVASVILFTDRVLGSRLSRAWRFAAILVFGLVFAQVMPMLARIGLFGSALQQKTVELDARHLPILLAGRTELPMTLTAILERPFLGWGSALNLPPDFYARAEHLAIRMGFDPTSPFERYWRLPAKDYSALHSILLASWAEGGLLAALLPAFLIVACIGVIWNNARFKRWGPLALVVALQGLWDLIYAPWTYNMIPEYACIALLFCAAHFTGRPVGDDP